MLEHVLVTRNLTPDANVCHTIRASAKVVNLMENRVTGDLVVEHEVGL